MLVIFILQIVNHLYKLGWLSSKELEGFVATHSETDCNTPLQVSIGPTFKNICFSLQSPIKRGIVW